MSVSFSKSLQFDFHKLRAVVDPGVGGDPSHTCTVVRRTKLLIRPYLLPLKLIGIINWMDNTGLTDHPSSPKQVRSQGGLLSMVKHTDGSTVWSNGPWNKYDPRHPFTPVKTSQKIWPLHRATSFVIHWTPVGQISGSAATGFKHSSTFIAVCIDSFVTMSSNLFETQFFWLL